MTKNDGLELRNFYSEDIDDVLRKIEKSYGFKFEKTELINVNTFGELCDIIVNKLNRDNVPDCTSQQAFINYEMLFIVHQDIVKYVLQQSWIKYFQDKAADIK